ncbi:MAG: YraN family protein [Actinomycetota bacterium]|nr:YraN family protein [Actinomycetota bacterium]
MSRNNKTIGSFGERLAADYLKDKDFKIIYRNYRCRFGEIDIIALKRIDLVFIEVKTRSCLDYGLPFEAVAINKLKKIKKASQYFLMNNEITENKKYNFRFDIVSVIISEELRSAVLFEKHDDVIDISKLKKGIDYSIKHFTYV